MIQLSITQEMGTLVLQKQGNRLILPPVLFFYKALKTGFITQQYTS